MSSVKNNLNGWLIINKDLGMTSRQTVNIIKKNLKCKKNWSCWHVSPFGNWSFSSCNRKSNKNSKIYNGWHEKI